MSGTIIIGIQYFIIFRFFQDLQKMGEAAGFDKEHIFFQFVNAQESEMATYFLILAAITIIILSIFGIFFSHRVAGPIYKMTKELKRMSDDGEAMPVSFRKNDFFHELQDAFNAFLEKKGIK